MHCNGITFLVQQSKRWELHEAAGQCAETEAGRRKLLQESALGSGRCQISASDIERCPPSKAPVSSHLPSGWRHCTTFPGFRLILLRFWRIFPVFTKSHLIYKNLFIFQVFVNCNITRVLGGHTALYNSLSWPCWQAQPQQELDGGCMPCWHRERRPVGSRRSISTNFLCFSLSSV